METESIRTLGLPCRLGELTLWAPQRRLWIHRADFDDPVPEESLTARFRAQASRAQGALLYAAPVEAGDTRLRFQDGLLRYVPQEAERHLVRLEGDFEDYMALFAGKTRSTLRRKVRRFEREALPGPVFQEYRGSAELATFLPLARQVSARSYQETMLDAGMPDDADFRNELQAAGDEDRARGYLLFHGEQPVAYLYCPLYADVARYEFVGYDPAFGRLSPGTVLLLKVLERLFPDPLVHVFDFTEGGGDDGHKAFFATETRQCGNVYYFPPTLRNLLVVLAHVSAGAVSVHTGRTLQRLGMKTRVRTALRALRGRS